MVCQGIYCSAAVPAACLMTARLARVWDFAVFDLGRLDFDFVFAMRLCAVAPLRRPSGTLSTLANLPTAYAVGCILSPLRGWGHTRQCFVVAQRALTFQCTLPSYSFTAVSCR